MADYCVTAVRYVNQELMAVQLGQGDGKRGEWASEPHEVRVEDVVSRIEAGDTVRSLLRSDGRVDLGPPLKVVSAGQGKKSLALDNPPSECLELADLERF